MKMVETIFILCLGFVGKEPRTNITQALITTDKAKDFEGKSLKTCNYDSQRLEWIKSELAGISHPLIFIRAPTSSPSTAELA